jgi:di/tricarboxylate transporter
LSNETEGLDRRHAVLVLMVASSASFLTPISHQTILMVMEPGKYNFCDFMGSGLGLQVVTMCTKFSTIVTVADVHLRWL